MADEHARGGQRADVRAVDRQWRAIPKDLPPRSTVYDYFDLWTWDRKLDRIHHALCVTCRKQAGVGLLPPHRPAPAASEGGVNSLHKPTRHVGATAAAKVEIRASRSS